MRIENDLKLDFRDVLIRPKRSTLGSRKDVNLEKTYHFCNSEKEWEGVPIIAANMDGVGTLNMSRTLASHHMVTALTKHYDLDSLRDEFTHINENHQYDHVIYSMGITQDDLDKFNNFKTSVWVKMVCIDVANFYSEFAIDFLKRFREKNLDTVIFAGNVQAASLLDRWRHSCSSCIWM